MGHVPGHPVATGLSPAPLALLLLAPPGSSLVQLYDVYLEGAYEQTVRPVISRLVAVNTKLQAHRSMTLTYSIR